ncbi:hypothetical protein [Oscillatoria sp. HE19RPO]|nr:hypothetical protein [Oscillatoria sp. HE19RPO]
MPQFQDQWVQWGVSGDIPQLTFNPLNVEAIRESPLHLGFFLPIGK